MARSVSKNAQRAGSHEFISRWGGKIMMRAVFKNGKMSYVAECTKTKNTASKPKMLM